MALFRKRSTPRLAAAARRNGHKSHGPKTQSGKQNSSLNAIRHGGFAKVALPHMHALGEDPAEFERHLQGFLAAFNPQDGYEETLAGEIAEHHWRLRRLKRAEAAFLASRLQSLQRDREWKAHLARRARVDAFRDYPPAREPKDVLARRADSKAVHYSGFNPEGDMNSPESPQKYANIICTLKTLRDMFLLNGFEAVTPSKLEIVFGRGANCLGAELFSALEACSKDLEKESADTQEYRRTHFLQALDSEIRYFQKEFQLYLAREVEVSREMADAQLLASSEDLERIIRAETHLERLIEIKRQQFFEWRREKANIGVVTSIPMATSNSAIGAVERPEWEQPGDIGRETLGSQPAHRGGNGKPRQRGNPRN
jgi:hypothetical protein